MFDRFRKIITGSFLLFMIGCIIALIVHATPRRTYAYTVILEEPAAYLTRHVQVYIGSVHSGYVDRIDFAKDLNHTVLLLRLNQRIDHKKAAASITTKGIMSSTPIIVVNFFDQGVELTNPMETLPAGVLGQIASKPSLTHKAISMFNVANEEVSRILHLTVDSFERLNNILRRVEAMDDKKITQIISDLQQTMATLKSNTEKVVRVITSAAGAFDAVASFLGGKK